MPKQSPLEYDIESVTEENLPTLLALLKYRCGQLGLFKTMHAMDEATKAIGWELAEKKTTSRS